MRIKCVVIYVNSAGVADFKRVIVLCSEQQYADGDHYKAASEVVKHDKLVNDENDGPKWLFEHWSQEEWDGATEVIDIRERG